MKYYIRLIRTQTKFELIKLFRMPVYIITLIGLPLFFYMATGTNKRMPPLTENLPSLEYLICTLGTFGVFGIALFGFGVNFSIERSQGWYHTLQPSPLPLWVVFFSKLLACFCLSAIAILLLFLEASVFYGVSMAWHQWLGIFFTLLLGSIPLASLGLFVGLISGSNSVSLITIVIYLSVASLSGLLATLSMLRKGNPELAALAVIYPTYHVFQLGLANLQEVPISQIMRHITILAAYTLGLGTLTVLLFKRNLSKTYG